MIQVNSGWKGPDQSVVICRRLWARREIPFTALLSEQCCKCALVKWRSLVPKLSYRYTTPPPYLLSHLQYSCWTPDVLTLSAEPPSTAAQSSFLWKRFNIYQDPHPLVAERSLPFLPSPSDTKVRSPVPKKDHLLL